MAMNPGALGGVAALVLAGAIAPAASAQTPPPKGGAEAAACADCHDEQGKTLPSNAHARIPGAEFGKPGAGNAACASCHNSGAKHMESSGEEKSDIRVLRGRTGAEFCLTCHTTRQAHASFQAGIHSSSEAVNCLSCHSVHSPDPKAARLLTRKPSELCASCHPAEAASFRNKPFAHRIGRGGMECTSCHDPHGLSRDKGLRLTRGGEPPCLSCHMEKRGPFVFEHVSGVVGSCTTCHEPHASSNNKRLVRARVGELCLECHSALTPGTLGSQPPAFHNFSLPRWQNCTTCHVAVHGSNLSPRLFK